MECKSTLKEAIPSRTSWWLQKDQDTIQKKSGVICGYKYDHFNTTGHNVTIENFSIVGREDQNLKYCT